MLQDALHSKKAMAAALGILVVALNDALLQLPESELQQILALIGVYIVGQGAADIGKEAAKAVDGPPG